VLKIKSILITSESETFHPIAEWCKNRSIDCIQQTQIEIKPLQNCQIPPSDWVFFSSPKSTKVYLENYPILAQSIAVYGKGTEKILIDAGIKVNFIGKGDADPDEIGRSFKSLLKKGETVLFPLSLRSKKSISKQLDPRQRIEITLYETILVPHAQEKQPDLILFTSPSNYESYCLKNVISEKTLLISMGNTTATVLQKHTNTLQLEAPNVVSFIKLLEKLVD